MPLYEKKWWKKVFAKPEKRKKLNSLKDVEAISEFLAECHADIVQIKQLVDKIEELEKERLVAATDVLHINIDTQAELFDQLLQRYQFFQDDVDITGLRVKEIAINLLHEAEKAGMKDLVKEKRKDVTWSFDW